MLRFYSTPTSFLLLLGLSSLGAAPRSATAQQRPALTEDPEPVPEGKMLLETGLDHAWKRTFPVSGLEGNIFRAPLLGLITAVGPAAEVSIEGFNFGHLSIKRRFEAPHSDVLTATGSSTSSIGDFVVGTKLRLVSETANRPAIGLRFATRLPNGGNEKGIGLDTMDFFQAVLIGKSIARTRVVGNIGFAILSDPTAGDNQNDVITYGLSIVHDIRRFALVFDANGWVSTRITVPPGTDTQGTATFGFRYTKGAVRFDAGYFTGLTSDDGRNGIKGGLSWTFDNFINRRSSGEEEKKPGRSTGVAIAVASPGATNPQGFSAPLDPLSR